MKYKKLIKDLTANKSGTMKVFGNSMLPIIKSGAILTYGVKDEYSVDDVVF